jgi:hypothetical protein
MTASSSVVISNLAYLVGAVVLAIIGGLVVWLRHRKPKSVAANVESFHRGLQALAPEGPPVPRGGAHSRADVRRVTAQPGVRVTPPRTVSSAPPDAPAAAAVSDALPMANEPSPADRPGGAHQSRMDRIDYRTDQIDLTERGPESPHDMGAEAGEAAADRAGAETG